jgi:hypothetical protein
VGERQIIGGVNALNKNVLNPRTGSTRILLVRPLSIIKTLSIIKIFSIIKILLIIKTLLTIRTLSTIEAVLKSGVSLMAVFKNFLGWEPTA